MTARTRVLVSCLLAFSASTPAQEIAAPVAPSPAEVLAAAPWTEPVAIADGVEWRSAHLEDAFGAPLFISVVEADLARPGVRVEVAFKRADEALERVSTLAPSQHPDAAAAINATFFNMKPPFGSVCYLRVAGEEIAVEAREPSWTGNEGALVIAEDGSVRIEVKRPADGWAALPAGDVTVIGCGPVLVVDGLAREDFGRHGSFCSTRHPRSLVGLTEDKRLLLVTIDGRAAESAGASCAEAALVMESLGCETAMNLDGGGSTTLWVRGPHGDEGVVNHPSDNRAFDHKGSRRVADAIVVVAPAGE